MKGEDFEDCMKDIYERLGYSVKGTQKTGDQMQILFYQKMGKKLLFK
jgi:HJR/Mrr/RecB family endonuclease